MIGKSVVTDFNPVAAAPVLGENAYVHPIGAAIGAVTLGKRVLVTGIVRADEGNPIHIGDDSNVQDGCIVHGLETESNGQPTANRVTGPDGKAYSVYIGERTSMAHQSQVHGPAKVGNDSFIAMQALIFKAELGNNCVVEPGAKLLGGVKVPDGRYVPAGSIIAKQADADALPMITDDYPLKNLNKGVVHVNTSLAVGYNKEQPL